MQFRDIDKITLLELNYCNLGHVIRIITLKFIKSIKIIKIN